MGVVGRSVACAPLPDPRRKEGWLFGAREVYSISSMLIRSGYRGYEGLNPANQKDRRLGTFIRNLEGSHPLIISYLYLRKRVNGVSDFYLDNSYIFSFMNVIEDKLVIFL